MAAMAARRPWPSFPCQWTEENLLNPGPGVEPLAVSPLRDKPPFFLQCLMGRLSMPPPRAPSLHSSSPSFLLRCSPILLPPPPLFPSPHRSSPSFLLRRSRTSTPPPPPPREVDLRPPYATSAPCRAHASTSTSTSGSGQQRQPRKQPSRQQQPAPPPQPPQQPPEPEPPQQQQGQDPNLPAAPQMEQYDRLVMNGPMFAPYQTKLDDIPVLQLDIKKEGLHGRVDEVTRRRIVRARLIAPGCYYNVPITPYPNPKNGKSGWGRHPLSDCGHSHYRIELLDSSCRERGQVQLLLRDFDQYMPAFRVGKDEKWSKWYKFNDAKLPPFISEDDIINLIVNGRHNLIYDIGGQKSYEYVFTKFSTWPQKFRKDGLKKPAMIAVVLFCEAFRDRFMHLEIQNRVKNDADPFPLGYNIVDWATKKKRYPSPDIVWNRYHSWSMFGETCTDVGMNGGLFDPSLLTENYMRTYGISHFQEMIGRECGHLLIIMRNNHLMEVTPGLLKDMQKKERGEDMANPDFDNLVDNDNKVIPLPTYDV